MSVLVTQTAPDFTAPTVMADGTINENFSLSDLKGKYVVLFFYPLDFTFVCPTEILAFDEALELFNQSSALVERLLRVAPDCELVLLVRDGKRTPAPRRTQREILKNDAFDRLREMHSQPDATETFADMTARRISTVAGDVSNDGLGLNDADRAVWATAANTSSPTRSVSLSGPIGMPKSVAALSTSTGATPSRTRSRASAI